MRRVREREVVERRRVFWCVLDDEELLELRRARLPCERVEEKNMSTSRARGRRRRSAQSSREASRPSRRALSRGGQRAGRPREAARSPIKTIQRW